MCLILFESLQTRNAPKQWQSISLILINKSKPTTTPHYTCKFPSKCWFWCTKLLANFYQSEGCKQELCKKFLVNFWFLRSQNCYEIVDFSYFKDNFYLYLLFYDNKNKRYRYFLPTKKTRKTIEKKLKK